ncbi:MAG: D-glycero-beta-D-manno-heptose 1,7-bisphosphate 7-phosphatase [Pseudomonadota bacterium]|nr:D-glycero-beta-D-manno-heptose 1,7-bisphosphate 7-phosphatase [Pseudomonadota bacterium]
MRMVILDRDGVINYDSEKFIKSPDEWLPIPGSLEAIARLSQSGFRVVLASNQSGVGRGLLDMTTLNKIHDKLYRAVGLAGGRIDAFFYCPHTQMANCDCRKPKTGMFREIAERFNISLEKVPAIGDSLRDLQAASKAGALPILVRTGKGEKTLSEGNIPSETLVFSELGEATKYLIEQIK